MRNPLKISIILIATLFFAGCNKVTPTSIAEPVETQTEIQVEQSQEVDDESDLSLAAEGFTKGGCGACHVIPGIENAAGTIGPDLSEIGQTARELLTGTDYKGNAENVVEYLTRGDVRSKCTHFH